MKFKHLLPLLALILPLGCQNSATSLDISRPVVEISDEADDDSNISSVITTEPNKAEIDLPVIAIADEVDNIGVADSLDYKVDFASQAPYGVWDSLHEEACEEAAMIIAVKYFKQEILTPHIMEQGLLNLIDWEQANNYPVDLTATEAKDILVNYFKLKAELVTEVTVDRIKKELTDSKLIIIPAAGRLLGNPYFQTPGPIYHMLVIRGYNATEFITNDPGTKRGDGFKYKYQTLINAIHDWDHQRAEGGMTDEEMAQGNKVMIVVN